MAGDPPPAKRSRENENENETAQRPTKRPRSVPRSIELLLPHTDALLSYNYNDTISVLVGPEERSFVAHKDVICASSKFFKAACSTRWTEGQEKVVRLPTVKPSVFEMYMDWLYFGEIAGNATGSRLNPLIHLSLLGDMVDDRDLRNKAMDALQITAYEGLVSPAPYQIRRIWENTCEGSMLRKWALDSILLRRRKSFEGCVSQYPPEFVRQIAVKLMQQTPATSSADFLAKTREYQELDDEA